ncbi:hypothetical protein HGRIS_004178 [Hohenbuehelia grisea]|uniref:Cation/H+ exchanger transmembrane domain-containing protein n=1 Tax=Hohenbuehelia grisea TaxID=104357 RepID=A0ABR3JIQ1_9AGAR
MRQSATYLPYHEPSIITVLVQSSFILLLNIINIALDQLVYCGLIGQVVLGVAWGTPGAQLLGEEAEHIIVQLGYLGLILLVYEGGLETSASSLQANFLLSAAVAVTGIVFPIALSFLLHRISDATPLQAFAAGAALCSTSLGTTFTILGTSGLSQTRLGVVLTSAAMMDDIVALIMVQVISNLGTTAEASFSPATVVRPVFVSIGLAILVLLGCRFISSPLARRQKGDGYLYRYILRHDLLFIVHTLTLVGFVTTASYVGTSVLFAAYLAGASISWYDSESSSAKVKPVSVEAAASKDGNSREQRAIVGLEGKASTPENRPSAGPRQSPKPTSSPTPKEDCALEDEGSHIVDSPESQQMASEQSSSVLEGNPLEAQTPPETITGPEVYRKYYRGVVDRILRPFFFASIGFSIPVTQMFAGRLIWRGIVYTIPMIFGKLVCGLWLVRFSLLSWKTTSTSKTAQETLQQPLSLYPASMLGLAMVARGEIGFLISSIAESNGIFGTQASVEGAASSSSDIYIVVTWAIALCTMIGPMALGLLVKRVKALRQFERGQASGKDDPLGIWGT